MKKIRLLLLFLAISTMSMAQWESYQNLDFSHPEKDSLTGMAYWRGGEHTQFITAFREENPENTFLKITGEYDKDRPGYVYQQYKIAVEEFTKVRISARIKGKDIRSGSGGIYCYTKNGAQWLDYKDLSEKKAVTGSTGWQQVNIEMWINPKVTTFRIGASMHGSGELWIDDFYVETISQDDCALNNDHLGFMQECMDLIATHSLYKNDIDTAHLMNSWKRLSACAKDRKEVEAALGTILRMIDNHSFYWSSEQANRWANTSNAGSVDIPLCRGHHIGEDYAYIWMPHFSSGDSATFVLFADHLQNLIDSLDHKNLKGWVFDLRENQGGNCWPMLAGIGPLMGEGVCGYFKSEEEMNSWRYEAGVSYLDNEPQANISRSPYVPYLENPPVAVLTGPKTSSSGEVVAIAFANRPNTRSFGQATGGFTTGNSNYTLSDGSMLFLAGSIYADRTKQEYSSGIVPDEEIKHNAETAIDEVMEKALEWLKKR